MADISSMTVASRKMYFFAIYVLNHLKENATIKIDESFDVLSLDTTLVNRFDPAVIQEMFKPKPKSKAKKSTLVRPVTNVDPENAVEAIANDFYQAPEEAPEPANGKSKRKYNKKVIDKATAVASAVVATTPAAVEQKEQEQKEGVVVADIVSEIVLASKMDLKTTKPKQARKAKKTNEPTTTAVNVTNEVAVNVTNEVAVNVTNEVAAVNVTNEVAAVNVTNEVAAVNVTNEVAAVNVTNEVAAVNVTNEVVVNEVEEPKPKAKRQPKKKATEPEPVVVQPVVVQEEAEAPMPNLESDVEVSKVKKQNAMKAVADKFKTNNPVKEQEIATEVVEPVQEQKKQPAKKESAKKESAKKESAKKKKVDNTDAEKENIPVEASVVEALVVEKPRKATPIMPQEEEEESDEIEARLITYSDGKQYLLSDDNSVYDQDTYEMLGTYDPEKYKITFL